MINIVVFSTVVGSLISGFIGRYIGVKWSRRIVLLSVIMSCIFTYILYYYIMIEGEIYRSNITNWINVEYLSIDWSFLLDRISISVLIPVVTVSSLVHMYAIAYMESDPHQQRFFSYLSFFTFGMIVLVTGDNLLILFLGWELIGVASYLLISFWFTRVNAAKSGLSALLMNRFGDTFLVIGLGLLIYVTGSLNYDTIFSLNSYISTDILTIILICFLLGCSSKSVQFGLHSWLLNSMEGLLNRALIKFHYMLEHLILNILFNKYLNKIYWSSILLILGKIQYMRQSAGNHINMGSSETTREKYYDNNFLYWLIGFTEGDGSFILNKSGTLEFKITQSYSNVKTLYYIKKQLGFGRVNEQDKNNNTWQFRVRDKNGLFNIINIFNGNVYLPYRQNQFKLFLEGYNKYYNTNIEYIPLNNNWKPSFNDNWLLGFIDAEGCFYCYYKDKDLNNNNKISIRFILSQKTTINIINELNDLLKGSITYQKSYDGYNITVGIRNLYNLIIYLQKNKLKTNKYIQYKSFYNIYNLLKLKIHYNDEGYNKIKKMIIKYKKILSNIKNNIENK